MGRSTWTASSRRLMPILSLQRSTTELTIHTERSILMAEMSVEKRVRPRVVRTEFDRQVALSVLRLYRS
jgi:hypothetical protein